MVKEIATNLPKVSLDFRQNECLFNIVNSLIYLFRFSSVNQQELDLPLAYVITAFTDPRNVELSLATIFR